jgi:hypothetical protein
MGIKLKWDVDGKGDEAWGSGGDQYTGEIPPKDSYIARLKRVTQVKIKSAGENKNKPRLSVLLEIVGGQGSDGPVDPEYKYYGAPVWDGINMINSPNGELLVRIVTKMGNDLEGNKRAEISQYLPYTGPKPATNGKVVDDDDEDEDEILDADVVEDDDIDVDDDYEELDGDEDEEDDDEGPPF